MRGGGLLHPPGAPAVHAPSSQLKPVALVEADGPVGRRPGPDQNAPIAETQKMLEQCATNALPLCRRKNVCMANQAYVAGSLDAHDAQQSATPLVPPELNPGRHLTIKLLRGHVGLMPSIGRDHATISHGRGIDDREHSRALVFGARSNAAHDTNLRRSAVCGPSIPCTGSSAPGLTR